MPRKNSAQFITKTCPHCGQPFTKPDWKVWREAIYCSLECYTLARRALPAGERAALMTEATARIRGAKRSEEELIRRAERTFERRNLSLDEEAIWYALGHAGIPALPQFPWNKYNIDFAYPSHMLAIEYNGGNWHNTPLKRKQDAAKRAFLESTGWTVLVIPRLCKPHNNNAGNECVPIDELVNRVRSAIATLPRALTE